MMRLEVPTRAARLGRGGISTLTAVVGVVVSLESMSTAFGAQTASRICYWLGGHVAADERRKQLERGVEAGRAAIALEPTRPEGYFWHFSG